MGWLLAGWLSVAGATAAEPWQRDPVLSQLLVKRLVADPVGYLWVATEEGVFRYDGYELLPLARLIRPGSVAAPKSSVHTLALDAAGHLWIGANEGLFCLTLRSGALRQLPLPHPAGLPPPTVGELFCHPRSGQLWVSCINAYTLVLDVQHGGRQLSCRRLAGTSSNFIADGSADGVWISLNRTLHFDPVARRETLMPGGYVRLGPTGPPRQFIPLPANAYLPSGIVRYDADLLVIPGTQPLRLLGPNALYELGPTGRLRLLRQWLPFGQSDNFRPLLVQGDSVGEWIARNQYFRLVMRGPRAGELLPDSGRLGEAGTRPVPRNFQVYRDGQGLQWCYSARWRGVYKRRVAPPQTVRALTQAGGLPLPSARGMCRLPDGRLLIGTYGESFVQAADSPHAPFRRLPFHRDLGLGIIAYDLLTTHRPPALTVAVEENLISMLDPPTQRITILKIDPAERRRPEQFRTLLEYPAGRVWVGTDRGLFELDAQRVVRPYQPPRPYHPPPGLEQLNVVDIAADSARHSLWLATTRGLYRLALATGELRRVGVAPPRPLPTADLFCVADAGNGRAWVGTHTDGLLLVDARRGMLQQLSVEDGLPSATVATVLHRPDGTVWAGTYAGLIRYDPARQRLAVFGTAAGLADPELNRNSAYADARTGTLLFGGVGGVFQITPSALGTAAGRPVRLLATAYAAGNSRPNTPTPPVRPLLAGATLPGLRLGADAADFVEIRLALTDLLTPELTHYTYRLRPAGGATNNALSAWLPTTRRLVLQGLAPGDYTLEVRAETGTGQLASNLLRMPLHVARVWWQHPLAALGAALLLLGLGYGGFWLQARQARRRARREARLRDELAANLHDEVGGLLTKISLMAEVLQQNRPPAVAADTAAPDPVLHQLAERLLLNSRAAVQALRDVVWSIDSRADSVQALLDRMEDHLDQTAAAAGLAHDFAADPLPDLQALPPLVRKHLYLIFKEAVTNAVRHARGATLLRVQLRREGRYVLLEVADDGQAPAGPSRTGLGLRSMAARAQVLHGTLHTGPRPDGQPGYAVCLRVKA